MSHCSGFVFRTFPENGVNAIGVQQALMALNYAEVSNGAACWHLKIISEL
jgi:hypothetical protein